jgi:hypothetical protein
MRPTKFAAAQPCFHREKDDDAVALRISGRLGEDKEPFYVLFGEYFGLLACHDSRES